ncbi:MAG: hypothetical protein ABIF77_04635 [bacterium]
MKTSIQFILLCLLCLSGLFPGATKASPGKQDTSFERSQSFDHGGVSIPVNVAFTTNPDGNRMSLLIGYAIASLNQQ